MPNYPKYNWDLAIVHLNLFLHHSGALGRFIIIVGVSSSYNISLLITEQAPIVAPRPIVTPEGIVTFLPIHTSDSTTTSLATGAETSAFLHEHCSAFFSDKTEVSILLFVVEVSELVSGSYSRAFFLSQDESKHIERITQIILTKLKEYPVKVKKI